MGSIGNMFSKLRSAVDRMVWGAPRITLASIDCPDPKDLGAEPGIVCRAGEDVVCDGTWPHVICTAAEDIKIGDDASKVNEQFYWFQTPPAIGTPTIDIKCSICGGRWVSSGMHLHFKGGWR